MTGIVVKIIGKDKLFQKLARVAVAQRKGMSRAIALAALDVATDARRSIQKGGKGGVTIIRGGKEHARSKAGEAPRTDTGRLASSIFAKLLDGGLEAEVGTGIIYGKWLELSTSKMEARPWLQPAFNRQKPGIRTRLVKAANEANRKTAKR